MPLAYRPHVELLTWFRSELGWMQMMIILLIYISLCGRQCSHLIFSTALWWKWVKWGNEAEWGAEIHLRSHRGGRPGIWIRKTRLQSPRSLPPYSDSVLLLKYPLQVQSNSIRSPERGSSCFSLPFREYFKSYPLKMAENDWKCAN